MKRIFILISFIFIFLSCCFTSFNSHTDYNFQRVSAEQQLENIDFATVKQSETNSEHYIVSSAQLNLSQIFSNLFGGFCGVLENINKKYCFQLQKFLICRINSTKFLRISGVLNPRAP